MGDECETVGMEISIIWRSEGVIKLFFIISHLEIPNWIANIPPKALIATPKEIIQTNGGNILSPKYVATATPLVISDTLRVVK